MARSSGHQVLLLLVAVLLCVADADPAPPVFGMTEYRAFFGTRVAPICTPLNLRTVATCSNWLGLYCAQVDRCSAPLAARVATLEKTVAQQAVALQQQSTTLQQQAIALQQQAATLQQQAVALQQQNTTLQQQASALQQQAATLQQQAVALQQQNTTLQAMQTNFNELVTNLTNLGITGSGTGVSLTNLTSYVDALVAFAKLSRVFTETFSSVTAVLEDGTPWSGTVQGSLNMHEVPFWIPPASGAPGKRGSWANSLLAPLGQKGAQAPLATPPTLWEVEVNFQVTAPIRTSTNITSLKWSDLMTTLTEVFPLVDPADDLTEAWVYCSVSNIRETGINGTTGTTGVSDTEPEIAYFARFTANNIQLEARNVVSGSYVDGAIFPMGTTVHCKSLAFASLPS